MDLKNNRVLWFVAVYVAVLVTAAVDVTVRMRSSKQHRDGTE